MYLLSVHYLGYMV
uniref:Uncharacterized protein n=1 Tax=Rhizophora mucronata TaxID=61149 RepID=A0A2P2QKR8_RHIMU